MDDAQEEDTQGEDVQGEDVQGEALSVCLLVLVAETERFFPASTVSYRFWYIL